MKEKDLLEELHKLAIYLKQEKITLEDFDKLAICAVYNVTSNTLAEMIKKRNKMK